jgi:hypothetical protein
MDKKACITSKIFPVCANHMFSGVQDIIIAVNTYFAGT